MTGTREVYSVDRRIDEDNMHLEVVNVCPLLSEEAAIEMTQEICRQLSQIFKAYDV